MTRQAEIGEPKFGFGFAVVLSESRAGAETEPGAPSHG
jgi:hypothetical protein